MRAAIIFGSVIIAKSINKNSVSDDAILIVLAFFIGALVDIFDFVHQRKNN